MLLISVKFVFVLGKICFLVGFLLGVCGIFVIVCVVFVKVNGYFYKLLLVDYVCMICVLLWLLLLCELIFYVGNGLLNVVYFVVLSVNFVLVSRYVLSFVCYVLVLSVMLISMSFCW